MLPVLTAVINSGAELIFFPLFQPEGNHLLIQARQLPELARTTLMSDGTLHIGRQALRDTLYSVKSFSGVNGELSCNRFGDCHPPCFNILRFDDPALGLNGLESNILFTYPPDK